MITIIGAKQRYELAHQIRLLVVVFGGTDPINRIRAAFLLELEEFVADFVNRGFPADAGVFSVDELHRIFQAMLTMAVLANCRTLGTMRPEIDWRIEYRFLTHPDAVLHHSIDRTAHGTMGTHGTFYFHFSAGAGCSGGLGFFYHRKRQLRGECASTSDHAGAPQKSAAIHGAQSPAQPLPQMCGPRSRVFRYSAGFSCQ